VTGADGWYGRGAGDGGRRKVLLLYVCVADGRWGGTHGAGLLPFWGIMLSLMLPINLVEECFDKGVNVGGRRWCGG
jgi:hypothetical protein